MLCTPWSLLKYRKFTYGDTWEILPTLQLIINFYWPKINRWFAILRFLILGCKESILCIGSIVAPKQLWLMFRECGRLLGAHVLANMKLLATYLIFLSIITTYVANEVNQSQCGCFHFIAVRCDVSYRIRGLNGWGCSGLYIFDRENLRGCART